jgi:hypothetical protein
MARSARLALKTLKIPESDPAWENVRYRNTATPTPAPATSTNSSKSITPGTTPNGPAKTEAKRGVMSKDTKEKRAKTKTGGAKLKSEVQMKDESAKASKIASGKGKEVVESKSANVSQGAAKRLPGSAKTPKAASGNLAETPARPATPVDTHHAQRDSISSSNFIQPKPSSTVSAQASHERKPNVTSTMRISKKVTPSAKDKERVKERDAHGATGVKRKKASREDEDTDEDAVRKFSMQKKRKTDEGAHPATGASASKEPRMRDLSLPKKPSTDLSPPAQSKPTAPPSPLPPPRPSQSNSPLASSSSRPRLPSDKDRSAKANGISKPRRRSPIYTSSEDEGEISQTRRGPLLPDFISNPRPRPPLPPAWDHVALRKRYDSSYQEYIAVFSLIIAQKSQIESLLKSDSDTDGGVELLETKELAKVASQHHSLKDELESIKSIFLTGKLPGEVSPRSD